MRRSLKHILTALVLTLISVLVGLLFISFSPSPQVPELTQNLPSDVEEAQQVFQSRVNAQFALPVNEDVVIDRLKHQGFMVDLTGKLARFTKNGSPCNYVWHIAWSVQDGVVSDLSADYGTMCL